MTCLKGTLPKLRDVRKTFLIRFFQEQIMQTMLSTVCLLYVNICVYILVFRKNIWGEMDRVFKKKQPSPIIVS